MSLGGTTTSSSSVDPDLKRAALENLEMAKAVGQLGYVPYKGPEVAGMSPGQIAAMQGTNMGAAAFGLPTSAVPTGADLSSYDLYTQALNNMAPGQRAFIEAMFIDPITGAAPTQTFGSGDGGGERRGGPRSGGAGGGYGGYRGYGSSSSDRSAAERAAMAPHSNPGGGTGAYGLPNPMTGGFAGFGGFGPRPSTTSARSGTGSYGLPNPSTGSLSGGLGGFLSGLFR